MSVLELESGRDVEAMPIFSGASSHGTDVPRMHIVKFGSEYGFAL